MQSWAEQQLAILCQQDPHWDLWTVARYPARGYWWCARPKGYPVAAIKADTPEALAAEIREQEAAR